MVRVLPGENLLLTFSLSNTGTPQGRYGTLYRGDPGTACDVRIRKFQRRTCRAADRRNQNFRMDGFFDTDCNNT